MSQVPQPGPYPVPGAPAPTPSPERRRSWFARHKVLTTLGVLALVVGGASALGSGGADDVDTPVRADAATGSAAADDTGAADGTGDGTGESTAAEPAAEAPEQTLPGVGTPVRDGKFEFTVTSVEAGVARVGDELFGQDAQGQYVLVHLTVANTGDEAQYFDGSSQKAFDAQGREFSADSAAAVYLGDANSFLNQINPGNTVTGTVVFDVPADVALTSLALHDSPFSGGVEVALG